MRGLSICSGVGGLDLAAERAGVQIVGQVELDDFCTLVLEKHWPDVPRWRDLKTFDGTECGPFDILFGGIPCQPFSISGKRTGTEDDRYLWPDMLRIVRAARPYWVVIENVAHFAHMALDTVWNDLAREGYEVGAYLLPASAVQAPHERQRTFVVAHTERGRRHRIAHAACGHELDGQETERREGAGGNCQSGANAESRYERALQSFVGRNRDGIPDWMDGHWPATPREAQYAWEPPRLTTAYIPNRRARMKALGNAVVPAQAEPIFRAIMAIEENVYEQCDLAGR